MAIEGEQEQVQEQLPPEVAAAQQRFQAAVAEFAQVNVSVREGEAPMALPPLPVMEQAAALDVIVAALIGRGLIDEQEFVVARITRTAEIVEGLAQAARDFKRQQTGIILAPAFGAPRQ